MNRDLKDSRLYEEKYGEKESRSSYGFFVILLVIVALFVGVRYYWTSHYGGVTVDGHSMDTTLQDGERLVVEYASKREAKRGDIIVVHVENYPEVQAENAGKAEEYQLKYLIKRLIAVEGDSLYCERGQIYIRYAGTQDFVPLDESYAYYDEAEGGKDAYSFATYTVGEGEIFFLGDNRLHSKDSRYNEQGGSHLHQRLYQYEDIFGIVPKWAIKHQKILDKILF